MSSTISFSGLVTGLDTSSWISALTALKNAKVETLEEEKSELETLQDIVSNIKSYFSSFRTALESLTDAKYGIDSMDMFVQNLANSSDATKATATATSSASRDSYEVGISQVATATKVNTAVRTTVAVTYTADETTKLSILGVEAGYVSVNNKEFQITKSDTIETLIEKLSDIGITATYEEDVGRFTITSDIYEVDEGDTNVFTALGITFTEVTGTSSSTLMTEGYVTIKASTLLSDIGASGGRITINNVVQTLTFSSSATVQDFLDYMNTNYGSGTATMDSDGIITITGVDIEEIDGGSNIITALGLTETVDSVTSTSGTLSYQQTEAATMSTKLGSLNTSFTNYKLVLSNGSSSKTVTLSASSTLQNVADAVESYASSNGMSATIEIDEDGIISITGDIDSLYISGGVATALGLDSEILNGTSLTSSALSYSITTTAETSTNFGELGLSGSALRYTILNERGETVVASTTVASTTTIEEWFNSLKQYGITGSISEEGVISFEGGIISGNLATALGLSSVLSGSVVSDTTAVSNELAGTTTTTATMTDTLGSLGITSNQTLTIVNGTTTTKVTFTTASTLQSVADAISSAGGTMTITDGTVSISGIDKLTGSLVSSLNLNEETIEGTSMYNSNLKYTITSIATTTTKFSDLGISGSNLTFTIFDENGTKQTTVSLASTATISDFITKLSSYGLTATIDDSGVITIDDGYITGNLASKLGLTYAATSTYVSSTTIKSSALSGTITTTVTMTSTLKSLGITSSKNLTIVQSGTTVSLTFTTASTLQSIADTITSYGGEVTFENNQLSISGIDYISGTLLTALGLTASDTGDATTVYSTNVYYTVGSIATDASKFSDYGITVSGKYYTVYASNGDLIASGLTLASDSTISDLISSLTSLGLTAYVDSTGAINIANGYITGTLASALGISSSVYSTNVVSVTQVSSVVTANTSTTASLQTTLASLGITGTTYLTINCDGTTTKYTFAKTATLADIQDAVTSAGGTLTISDGIISVSGVSLSGTLASSLGLSKTAGSIKTYTTTSTEITSTTVNTIPTTITQTIKTITTTLTTTESLVYRSSSLTYATTTTEFDSASTKLTALGCTTGNVTIYNASTKTSTTVYTITSSSTLSDLLAVLEANGISTKYENGIITLQSDNLAVRSSSLSALGLSENITYETLKMNSSSTALTNLTTNALSSTTTLGVFTTSAAERILELEINGETYSKTFSATDTVQTVLNYFKSLGITATMSNGTFRASSTYQEFAISGSLGEVLIGSNPTITSSTRTTAWQATIADSVSTATISGTTKLQYLGVTSGDIKIYNNGEYIASAINITEDTTINDLITALANYGFTASLSSGKLTITADSNMYLLDETSNLVSALGLSKTYTYTTVYESSTSSELSYTKVKTITTSTTLEELGFSSGSEVRLSIDGIVYSLGFSQNETIQDVIDALSVYGITATISNGTFKASSTEHIFTISGDLGKIIASTAPVSTTITTVTGYTGELAESVNAVQIDEDTLLINLGVNEGSIKIYDNGEWVNTAINITDTTTIGDLISALEGYGFTAELSDGKLTISADSDKYLSDETSNLVSKLGLTNRTQTYVNIYDQTNSNTLTMVNTYTTSLETTLDELGFSAGASLRVEIGGVIQTIGFTSDETIQDIIDALSSYGISADLNNGTFTAVSTTQTFNLLGTLAEKLTGSAPTYITTEEVVSYTSDELTNDVTYNATTNSKLTDLGVSTGYINLLIDGEIATTIAIKSDTTVGQLFSALAAYGVSGTVSSSGVITIESIGNITLLDGTSDLVSVLGLDDNIRSCTYQGTTLVLEDNVNIADEDTLVSYYDNGSATAAGSLYLSLYDQDGNLTNVVLNIEETDTIADLIEKLENAGLSASFEDGVLSYHNGLGSVEITGGTSSLADILNLSNAQLETWMQSTDTIQYVQNEIEYLSICNYADTSTTLETLGVTTGSFAIGINGLMININVSSTDTIANLFSRISNATNGSVTASMTSTGKFELEAAEGVELIISSTSDSSNIVTVFNLSSDGSNKIIGGTSLYKVSSASTITSSGLFRLGDVTEGTFTIGSAEFTITSDTTIASLVNEINRSEEASANAYWDSINGRLVLTSTALGSSYINISAGTSNFTEIFGLTVSDSGVERLTTYNQTLGDNAICTINGTRVVSTSNTITSDISRIEGLTINLKGVTEGEYVTITVERDTQSIEDAVQEVLDAYNTLIAELNTVCGIGGDLHSDSALKSIKTQISSIMTAKGTNGTTLYRNLAAIGISTESASTALTSDIYSLYLDTDTFENALETSEDAVKLLLVGTDSNPGILTRIENIVENALSTSGYFSSKSSSLKRQISSYESKIEKAQAQVDSYKSMLENKFYNMEIVYSNMQSAYSSLLS